MTSKEFNKVVKERINKINTVLVEKAKVYATDSNRMHNFDIGAEISGQSRERVLNVFLLEHIISYVGMLDNIDNGKLPSKEKLDETIGVIINYFILFEASVIDKIEQE